jgi:hypothetical protein
VKVLQIGGNWRGAFVWERMENAQSPRKISQFERDRSVGLGAGVGRRKANGGIAKGKIVGSAVGQGEQFRQLCGENAAEQHADNGGEQNPRANRAPAEHTASLTYDFPYTPWQQARKGANCERALRVGLFSATALN